MTSYNYILNYISDLLLNFDMQLNKGMILDRKIFLLFAKAIVVHWAKMSHEFEILTYINSI